MPLDHVTSVTLLTTANGKRASKLWTKETIKSYDAGIFFSHRVEPVANIRELSALLTSIEGDPRTLIVRGTLKPVTELKAAVYRRQHRDEPVLSRNGLRRVNEAFDDLPKNFCLIDVDRFVPDGVDPLAEPVQAIEQYIYRHLPSEFHGCSYHWQLSSSAGAPGKAGVLKAHIWFWLRTAYTSAQLREWAKGLNKVFDETLFQRVQVHYTAAPVFDGVEDPVPVRSGFVEGLLGDDVMLTLEEVTLLRAEDAARRKETGRELRDPKDKPGVIGAFHRAVSMEELLSGELAEHFERGSQEHRLTWTGGNSPEGAFITDDGEHIVITNNTSPLEGPINKFDLVRHFLFGHLDEGMDPFEILEMRDRPSYQAMVDWCMKDKRVLEQLDEEKAETRTVSHTLSKTLIKDIANATNQDELHDTIVPKIQKSSQELLPIDLDKIVAAYQAKEKKLCGLKPRLNSVRALLAPLAQQVGRILPDTKENGRPLCTTANLAEIISSSGITVRYNVMSKEEEIIIPNQRFSMDNHASATLNHIKDLVEKAGMSTNRVTEQLTELADSNQYNPVLNWIKSKPWDRIDRLSDLYKTLVVKDDHVSLRDMLLSKWLLSGVYAAAEPEGVAAQGMLVLTGEQYIGKTRWFKRLVGSPEMFREGVTLDPKDKDSVKKAISSWITEIGELDATFRKADIAGLKAFLTSQHDIFRKPYGARESRFARRTVFGGTVNEQAFLKDPTGNRRFYTIHVLAVNHNHDIDMQQLWAQIYETMYLKKEPHWLDNEWMQRLNEHNEIYTDNDYLVEMVEEKFDWSAPNETWKRMTASDACEKLSVSPERGGARKMGGILGQKHITDRKRSHGSTTFLVPPLKPPDSTSPAL